MQKDMAASRKFVRYQYLQRGAEAVANENLMAPVDTKQFAVDFAMRKMSIKIELHDVGGMPS